MTEQFYKLANPDGWDFYTGKTINYRNNIGKVVKSPKFNKDGELCTEAFIHASRKPDQCFVGAKIPCSAYLVSGNPIKEDISKCGFGKLKIIKELIPKEIFKWDYELSSNPVHPFKIKPSKIDDKILNILKEWDSVRASVGASVGASVWDRARDSVWDSVRASVRDSVWESVWDSVMASVWDSVGESVWASVWDSVGESVWDSVRASVRDSVWAYIGFIFIECVNRWKYVNFKYKYYPFQPAIDLWNIGLIPSFDGKSWRLYGGDKGKILWKGEIESQ